MIEITAIVALGGCLLPGHSNSPWMGGRGFWWHEDGTEDVHRGTRDHWWSGDAFGGTLSSKVGKHVAGRRLDGRTWDQAPVARQ